MHLDGDHGIEGGSRGRHDGEINTELYGTRGNDVRYCSWTANTWWEKASTSHGGATHSGDGDETVNGYQYCGDKKEKAGSIECYRLLCTVRCANDGGNPQTDADKRYEDEYRWLEMG
ncbi:unnamed protein product [Clonostachys rosea f. rosea IK726]|uniref:Uncharacterized protein n=1 Tax=Clonostachys rosea f. rosea IK726 TaxID=1349383 RepID=A0ACA9U8Q7_BIOOC|nr:unnamed protein product [Clonostachys rosea f. rosea IK726]